MAIWKRPSNYLLILAVWLILTPACFFQELDTYHCSSEKPKCPHGWSCKNNQVCIKAPIPSDAYAISTSHSDSDLTKTFDSLVEKNDGASPDQITYPEIPGRFRLIPSGTFMMGSPNDERCRTSLKETRHQVQLTNGFELSETEVTQAQFQQVMAENPAQFKASGSDYPVENISWHKAAAYCNTLSQKQGFQPCYQNIGSNMDCSQVNPCSKNDEVCIKTKCVAYRTAAYLSNIYNCQGFRLPTDAEQEYAYRANSSTAFYNNKIENCDENDPFANAIGWYNGNSANKTHPVKSKAPNAYLLYDLAGNVAEWAHDHFISDLGTTQAIDPVIESSPTDERVVRGGSGNDAPRLLRAASRISKQSTFRDAWLGFRCARTHR